MSNPHGTPIWYELLSDDGAASKAFYDDVIGWKIGTESISAGMDYRMITTSGGEFVGGMLPLTDEMRRGGAKPTWLVYLGVDDVDETVKRVQAHGGAVYLPPFDIPEAGRAAMVADPQGNPFYVMRGSSPEASRSWERAGMGKCNWNELAFRDQQAGQAFYAKVFGWSYPNKMEMPEGLGDYAFIEVGGETIGAAMTANSEQPPGWQFYFRAPDIHRAVERVKAGGGEVLQGPMEVPGGDMIIVARDPHGIRFGVAAPGA